MKKFHLDYQRLRRINKAIVYCSISGFGQTGPYRDRPAYDIIAYAMSGIMASTGEPGRPPVRMSVPVADLAAGHYASTAILAALSKRLVTGKGDYIDIALYDSIVSWLTYQASCYFATGKEPEKMGSAHPSIVPYQAFKCKDDYLIVAVGNDQQWKNLCKATGLEKLEEDVRFSSNVLRVKNRRSLLPVLQRTLKTRSAKTWERTLMRANVPVTRILDLRDAIRNQQTHARKMSNRSRREGAHLGSPMKFYNSIN